MASLEEIRKRFAKVNSGEDGTYNGSSNSASIGASSVAASALSGAALKIFDPMKKFEVQVSEITKIAEPLERVLNQTARTLEEIKVFSAEMERLAKAYEGIRTFQAALNAEASRELRQQFDGIEKTFYENLSTAAALLDPAREFQTRIAEAGENLRWTQTAAGQVHRPGEELQTAAARRFGQGRDRPRSAGQSERDREYRRSQRRRHP